MYRAIRCRYPCLFSAAKDEVEVLLTIVIR